MMTGQKCTITQERAENVRLFRDTLALFVGAGRMHAAETIAAATGISTDTIHRYLRGEGGPEWSNALALMAVLPPEFAGAVLQPAGLTGLCRIDGECGEGETLSHTATATAEMAAALADGRIDHTEMPRVRTALRKAAVAIGHLLQKWRKS